MHTACISNVIMADQNNLHPRRLLILLLVLYCGTPTSTYRSVNEYYFNIGKEEHLYDTGTLPEGETVTVYLFQNEPQSFFYPVEGHSSPVSVTVIPCSATVEWKVYFHEQHLDKKMDNLHGDPLFLQEEKISGKSSSGLNGKHLHTFQGKDMTTFSTNGHLPKGILRVVVMTKDGNTRVQLYVSSNHHLEQPAPILPETPGVDIVVNDRSSVTVAWKTSPSHKQWGQHIKYCVAFNPRLNYRTLCALHADLEGEPPPPWPRHAGFGFRWEDIARSRIMSLRKHFQKSQGVRRDIHLECVGGRHWALITSLLPNKQYFVDVFAINEETNRSSAYAGATFITPGRPPLPVLKTGVLTTAHVGGSLGSSITYEHELKTSIKKFTLFWQTCSRDVVVDIIYEGAVAIRSVPITGFKKLTLRNAEPGNYSVRLSLTSDEGFKVPVRMCLVGRHRKCPYSGVPMHRIMNVTMNIASCRSVTLQWPSADSHAKYCLYKTRLPEDHEPLLTEYEGCPSGQHTKQEKPLFCRIYKKSSPLRNGKMIVETVWNLKKNMKYGFHLQAVLRQGVTVNYEPVFVDMEDKC